MDFNLVVQSIESLPSLPQAYHKCCYLLEQDVTDSSDLAQVVKTDPAMTIAVLRLVNSAFYNVPRKIERLDHAISILGHSNFRDLILTTSLVKAMSDLAGGLVDMEVFWRHSIYTALVAKRLALYAYLPNSERLFLAGLLHDIGQLIYFDQFETKATKITQLVSQLGVDVSVAETKVLGFTHQDIGSALCKRWNLPEWLEQPIKFYHKPSQAKGFEHESHLVLLANAIAEQQYGGLASLGQPHPRSAAQVDDNTLWNKANVARDMLPQVLSDVDEQLGSVMASLVPDLTSVT